MHVCDRMTCVCIYFTLYIMVCFTVVGIDDQQYGFPEVFTFAHYTESEYCVSELLGECAYTYWLIFKLVPILLHVLGFILQCLTWWHFKDFTPQQRQYDSILSHLYPDLYNDEYDDNQSGRGDDKVGNPNVADPSSFASSKNTHNTYVVMFKELMIRPSDSVFSFIEMTTVFYVWGELWFPPIYCGSVRPLSLYYYPILMSLLELMKFNVYTGIRICTKGRYLEGLFAVLNLDMFITNFWISVVLASLFVSGLVTALSKNIKWSCKWFYCRVCGNTESEWMITSAAAVVVVSRRYHPGGNDSDSGSDSAATTTAAANHSMDIESLRRGGCDNSDGGDGDGKGKVPTVTAITTITTTAATAATVNPMSEMCIDSSSSRVQSRAHSSANMRSVRGTLTSGSVGIGFTPSGTHDATVVNAVRGSEAQTAFRADKEIELHRGSLTVSTN